MSLLEEAMENFIIQDKTTTADGYGGFTTAWTDGATIKAAAVIDASTEGRIAQAMGVTGIYTITTKKSVNLQYHDVIRRQRDGKIFRITSDGDDKKTPGSASLNMRTVSAEEWSLTT